MKYKYAFQRQDTSQSLLDAKAGLVDGTDHDKRLGNVIQFTT